MRKCSAKKYPLGASQGIFFSRRSTGSEQSVFLVFYAHAHQCHSGWGEGKVRGYVDALSKHDLAGVALLRRLGTIEVDTFWKVVERYCT